MRNPVVQEDLAFIASGDLPWEGLTGKTVLVTGANGFLPAYMIETLLYLNESREAGIQVLALARNRTRAQQRFPDYERRSDFQWIIQDVCHPVDYPGPIDYIIHAASQASPKYFGVDPVGTLNANILGTSYLLEVARQKQAEFLYFSSGEVYGLVDENNIPTGERGYGYVDPLNIRSCYAESKRMGETMCVAWGQQYGVTTKIVRPFHVFGPGMLLDDGRVFADFVSNILQGRDIVLKSDGLATRSFCYLADATLGFFTVMLKGAPSEAYNVGNEDGEIAIGALAETLVALFPEKGISVSKQTAASVAPTSPIVRSCPDTTRLRGLGWKPKHSLEQGFQRTIRSFEPGKHGQKGDK